jgi:hypothetical protein
MPVKSSADFLLKAVIAALVGSVAGGAAGVWSLRSPTTSVSAAPAVRTADASPQQPTRAHTNAAAPAAEDEAIVLERAHTLARRPDVMGLIALRNDVVRRATERGIGDSSSIKVELDEVDRRLNEARMLQLKLDAEEFRKTASPPAIGVVSRPRDPQQ